MSSKITPCIGRVLIKPITVETKTDGGIILSGEAGSDFMHAKILAVGKGMLMADGLRKESEFKKGQIVIYGGMQNTVEDSLNGDPVLLVVEQAIVAIIKE